MSSTAQQLRNAIEVGDTVLVTFRAYAGRAECQREGTVLDKERAFAKIKFDRKTEKIPYSRITTQPKAAPVPIEDLKAEVVPPGELQRPPLRVVPAAFLHLVEEEPAFRKKPRTKPHPQPAHVAEHAEHVEMEPPQSESEPHATLAARTPTTEQSELIAWLEMGQSLLGTLRESVVRLRAEAADLAAQAQSLVDESDAKELKAKEVERQIAMLEAAAQR